MGQFLDINDNLSKILGLLARIVKIWRVLGFLPRAVVVFISLQVVHVFVALSGFIFILFIHGGLNTLLDLQFHLLQSFYMKILL